LGYSILGLCTQKKNIACAGEENKKKEINVREEKEGFLWEGESERELEKRISEKGEERRPVRRVYKLIEWTFQ